MNPPAPLQCPCLSHCHLLPGLPQWLPYCLPIFSFTLYNVSPPKARGPLLNWKSDHVSWLLRSSRCFPSHLGLKSKVYPTRFRVTWPLSLSLPWSPCSPSCYTPASLAFLLSVKHTECPLASCPWHLLSPLPSVLFPQTSAWLASRNITEVSAQKSPLREAFSGL